MTYTIDLGNFKTPRAKVFTTRPRGEQVRRDSGIDTLEPRYSQISIVIPDDIASINPSFLEEFLLNVVIKLGEKGFHDKFSFVNNGKYKIDDDLEEAIDRILREDNALPELPEL